MIDEFSGDYEFLSNFYPCRVRHGGMFFPSAEHAYQAAKALRKKDRIRIRDAPTPGRAKRLGQQIEIRPNFEAIRVEVMREVIREKFRDELLGERLLATGDEELVEGNWWGDRFWGVYRGEGANMLGEILMEERARLYTQKILTS